MKFEVTGSHQRGDVLEAGFQKVMDTWDDRIDGLVVKMPAQLAEELLKLVQSKAPKDAIKGYPDYLAVKRLSSQIDGFTTFGVLPPGWAFSQRLGSMDAPRTVLYVRPKVIRGESDPSAVVLARRNPWTMDTLPYEPNRREAGILARQVSEREARKIEHMRNKDRPDVVAELKRLGKPIRPKTQVTLTRRVTRDLFFEVCRVEFGVERAASPHWRPATRALTKVVLQQKLKKLMGELFDPDSHLDKYRSGHPIVPNGVIKRVQRFQDLMMPSSIG